MNHTTENTAGITPATIPLALEIADAQARADIECFCAQVVMDRVEWFDTDQVASEDIAVVDLAMRYIEARSEALPYVTLRHTVFSRLYRFEDRH